MSDGSAALAEEQAHLDRAYRAYEAVLTALRGGRAATAVDEFAEEALAAMRRERLRAYTQASGPLYFGRIDDAAGAALYIGRHAVHDRDNRLLAINWRAPAAEPFYAATPAQPRGVRRRRRLDIENRRVAGFVDELLGDHGEDHLTEAIVEDITRRRVGEMRQIISTITPEQYALITAADRGALVVQGGPGTGKTAVGLHRAAWLLYRQRELQRLGVLVVGPNPTFIRYISQVLPSLGEQSVEQRPIDSLVTPWRRPPQEDPRRATLKGSGRMAVLLERVLWDRVTVREDDATVAVGRAMVTVSSEDIASLVASAREATRSYQAGRERFRDRLAGLVAARVGDRLPGVATAAHEDVMSAVRKTRDYQRLAERTWPRMTPEQLVKRLVSSRARLAALASELLSADEIALLLQSPVPATPRDMTPTDIALLDEARWLIDPDFRSFGHVIVDEAQNLTAMELRMAVRRARGQSLTILGDIMQRTADAGVSRWASLLTEAGVREHVVRDLRYSYRVPGDFLRLAAGVLPEPERIPTGVRTAPWPAIATQAPVSDLGVVTRALAARMADDAGSVGVVVPARRMAEVRARLAAVPHADARRDELGAGINLVDLQLVKGLEFDAVIVVEPTLILEERPDGGAGGLYTALTRSTRALAIVHSTALPDELGGAQDLEVVDGDDPASAWASRRRLTADAPA